ncbi:DUF3794 domain-containing protein [Anoxybacillus ayderensis]|uniref:DUF3794 domain-containing protein n=1 Tax=Anoxybacillus ayderensis TaxID=265546 RepID=UPI000A26AD45|nr:DUF3794 domain-containing protein [Anoxybacillus ayderensis]MED0657333.1 DUF3794 domain-containing protein [Anoxybacillus ayderensis]OSX54807.1 hypothetical protein B7H16_04185 [Anoxybacillus ayderensis]
MKFDHERLTMYVGIAGRDEFPPCPLAYKQFTVTEKLIVPKIKPDIEKVIKVMATVHIHDARIIPSPYDSKIVVNGRIKQIIMYTARKLDQPVHTFHSSTSFCEMIILPSDICLSHIKVESFLEDMHIFHETARKVHICKVVCLVVTEEKKCCS